jgi:hypothetical protein
MTRREKLLVMLSDRPIYFTGLSALDMNLLCRLTKEKNPKAQFILGFSGDDFGRALYKITPAGLKETKSIIAEMKGTSTSLKRKLRK